MAKRQLATPLAGLTVLEFSHTVMGPTAGLIFAELGADVVKIEPAARGDHTRGLGGFGAGLFAAFNRNKRSLAVDLKRPEGQAVIHRLAPKADVVLEARPMPARRGAWAIYEVFKAAGDGQLFIGVTSDQQWTRFVEEFGLQELAADPRLATNVMRLAERSWLIPALQEVLAAIPQDEVARRCERANVSWAPVGQPGDLFTDEHLLATGGLIDVFISRFGEPGGKVAGLP